MFKVQQQSRILPVAGGSPSDTSLERELAYATLLTGLAVVAGLSAERLFGFDDPSLVFMTAVVFASVRARMSVAVFAAVLSFLAYNYFFIEPRSTLYIAADQGLATVIIFLVAALACARLASRLRGQVLLLQAANTHAESLRSLGRRLTAATSVDLARQAAVGALRDAMDADVVVLDAEGPDDALVETPVGAGSPRFDPALHDAARHCLAMTRPGTGEIADSGPELRELSWHCIAIAVHGRVFGVACLRFPQPLPQLPPPLVRLAEAMVRDFAQALERLRLTTQLESVRVQAETERLRVALLSSVSHDLRSPLATIIGSAESLDAYHDQLSASDQVALARDILKEGQRLDRYIQNLLDMTRLGQGAPVIEREWIGLDEVVGAALGRIRRQYPRQRIEVSLPAPAPLLRVNPSLVEQALFNVLDNAAKFTKAEAMISLSARQSGNWLEIDVIDRGPGIAEADRDRVFDMFHSTRFGDRDPGGTGLGLTICRGILSAHQGTIEAMPGPDGQGTRIRIRLPLEAVPAEPRDD